MQIYEEYFKRHSIRMPLVKHVSLGYLFFRKPSDTGFYWEVVSIYWNEPSTHPGYYTIRRSAPMHDSRSFEMDLVEVDRKLAWDSYEEFFYNWSHKCDKNNVVSGNRQVILNAWEMFVFSHDSYFTRTFRNLSGLLFETLDFNSPLDKRYASYQTLMRIVDDKLNPFKLWKTEVNVFSRNYCHWLADLIQHNGK